MRDFTREEWLALTPADYLANGYLDEMGHPRPDFVADYATAAMARLCIEEVSPQELAFVFEALRLLLLRYDGPPRRRLVGALTEAFEVVARAIGRTVNAAIVTWLNTCVAAVTTEAELEAFINHVQAVVRRYTVMVELMSEPLDDRTVN